MPMPSARRSPAAAASEPSTPATVKVTDRMMAASRIVCSCAASRRGISTSSMATNRPSTKHHRIDGSRIVAQEDLDAGRAQPPAQRRRVSAARKRSAPMLTPTKATAGQKSCHMRSMLS